MKIFFTIFSCLVCGMGFAETIQHVEYHLPKGAENWVVAHQLENKNGITRIYIPQGIEKQSATEFFGVNANHRPSNFNDSEGIKLGLMKNFSNMNVDFQVLEKDKDSLTYEWSAQENGVEKVHGWGRAFSNNDGSVVISYQTENISGVTQARSIWLPVLKEAKQQS